MRMVNCRHQSRFARDGSSRGFSRRFILLIICCCDYVTAFAGKGDDILLLLNHYLEEFGYENERKFKGFTPQAYDILAAYDWPGNIRRTAQLSRAHGCVGTR